MPSQYLLKSFGIIEITGQDQKNFLHGQFSNNILDLKLHEACYATYNNSKGRILANFIVCCIKDIMLIVIKKDMIPTLIQKLDKYKLRSKITLTDKSEYYHLIGYVDRQAIAPLPFALKFSIDPTNQTIICPNGSRITIYEHKSKLPQCIDNENVWNIFEITQGFSWISKTTSEKLVAQMLNQEWFGAVNFNKGCYPGQEVIARSQYRGEVKRRPALLVSQNYYSIGSTLYQDNEEVGVIVNTAYEKERYIYLSIIKINAGSLLHHNKITSADTDVLQLQQLFYYQKDVN